MKIKSNPSLRGARSEASATKQSINNANHKMDCHDLTSSSLAKQGEAEVSLVMTKKEAV